MKLRQTLFSRFKIIPMFFLITVATTIWLLNVSKPGAEIVGCFDSCAAEINPSEEGGSLRVLNLNMLHGYPNFVYLEQRAGLLSQEISRLAVDIVLLQEVPWTNEHGQIAQLLAEQNGFNYVYYRANGNRRLIGFEEGAAVLSRYPLREIRFTELQPAASFFENRIVLHATVETPQGSIDLFVTHLTNGQESINAAQTESLLAYVQKEATHPAIVAGDFNALETSSQILKLAEIWQDSYRVMHPNEPGQTCCIADLTSSPLTELQNRVDYLFLVPMAENVLNVVMVERIFAEPAMVTNGRLWLSDHAGLLATITIEPAP